eukprot:CAMPEP_0172385100 /NCGR_PEP_ID=MMETSP1061-20121228/2782_1 /TAXON_ID=37318 /ORGANISM="Pseudo-nitzschia pungens, Strain cf. pungens" /LENGTH=126 /DNA_ID=CAMNT_0013113959 /DNA_START=184 /DNA_END=564 /DNA_ORIENTATION=+
MPSSSSNSRNTRSCGRPVPARVADVTSDFFTHMTSFMSVRDDHKVPSPLQSPTYIPETLFSIDEKVSPSPSLSSSLPLTSSPSISGLLGGALDILADERPQERRRASPTSSVAAKEMKYLFPPVRQ